MEYSRVDVWSVLSIFLELKSKNHNGEIVEYFSTFVEKLYYLSLKFPDL
ncbi:hypothetical protein LCGC14_1298880, partial [marine sediment metagenome]